MYVRPTGDSVRLDECGLLGKPLADVFVVDVHGHLGSTDAFEIPANTAREVVGIMDRIWIDVLCVSHLACFTGGVRRGNDMAAHACRTWPGRFIGYAVVDPNRPDEIER